MPTFIILKPRFPLGQIVITANAHSTLARHDILEGLQRHAAGDWGSVGDEDAEQNDFALRHHERVLSAYGDGPRRFWIITEADRSVTTILMPEDY